MNRFTLYAAGSATAAGVATHTVTSAQRLVGALITLDADSVTDNASVVLELSTLPTSQLTTNDAREIIAVVRLRSNVLTSGMAQQAHTVWVPLDVAFRAADILYLHATVGGTLVYATNITLWFK